MNNLLNNIIQTTTTNTNYRNNNSNNNGSAYLGRQHFQLQNLRIPPPPPIQNNVTTINNNSQSEILSNIQNNYDDDDEPFNEIVYYGNDVNNTNMPITSQPIMSVPIIQNHRFIQMANETLNIDFPDGLSNEQQEDIFNEILRSLIDFQTNDGVNTQVLNNSMYDIGGHIENDEDEINTIRTKLSYEIYKNVKHIVKNDTCPISYCEFNDDDEIIIMNPCYHCLSKDFEQQFLKNCFKCPLCNYQLL